jgi:hypothetical protein
VHDETATTQAPRVTDLDDAHVEGDQPDDIRSRAFGEDSSPNAWVCPFLRATTDVGTLARPLEAPDAANTCSALGQSLPQSLRQQELVCLTSSHVNCPRHLRGTALGSDDLARIARPTVTPAIAGSVVVVIVAFLLSIAFVVVNRGLTLTAAEAPRSPSPIATSAVAGLETTAPTPVSTPAPTPAPSAIESTAPAAGASPTASLAPTATPAATPRRTPKPTATAPAYPVGATASRMKLLSPCSDTPRCYVYRVRSGDNLYSIANYFGVQLSTVKSWNAWTATGLKVGRELRIPPPTR